VYKRNVQKVIIIAIPYLSEVMTRKNPGIIKNVVKYNKVFYELAKKYNFIFISDALDSQKYKEEIFVDGYHPNVYGNDLVFRSILKYIE